MTLHYHQTTVTPREVGYIHNVLSEVLRTLRDKDQTTMTHWELQLVRETDDLSRWLGNVRHELWTEWKSLPDGDHLKESYRNETWTWDDTDLCPPSVSPGDEPQVDMCLLED